jgi:hypothetical protein
MYKAFIEPDLKAAQLRIHNPFNPFSGFMSPTYILKSARPVSREHICEVLEVSSWVGGVRWGASAVGWVGACDILPPLHPAATPPLCTGATYKCWPPPGHAVHAKSEPHGIYLLLPDPPPPRFPLLP